MKKLNPTKFVSGKVVLSYVQLNEPKTPKGGEKPKYSVSVIIPKSDVAAIERFEAAVKAAYESGIDKFKKNGRVKPLSAIHTPLHDGDEKGEEAYNDSYYFNCSSFRKPDIVDRDLNPIMDNCEIYSGIIARVSVNLYAYNFNGATGIAAGLMNVQKLADGTPLGGYSSAADDFGDDDEKFLD